MIPVTALKPAKVTKMSPRMRAGVAIGPQFMVWLGTVGLVYIAVPELVPVYLVDDRGTAMTDGMGNRLWTGVDPESTKAQARYDPVGVYLLVAAHCRYGDSDRWTGRHPGQKSL